MAKLRMAVIGVGHLGKAHARILAELSEVDLVGVADIDYDQAIEVAQRYATQPYQDFHDLIDNVDAVSVVTPTTSHHAVARTFLQRGIPVLVEKPITTTLNQADELIDLARQNHTLLQVGHIERFNPAFEELRRRTIRPKFIECERHGPFTGRSTDIGAVLDLMIHDLDLLLDVVGDQVHTVEAMGASIFGGHEDLVNTRLVFANGCIAHVTASRITPKPKRRLRIWAPEGYAGVDFLHRRLTLVQATEELRRYGLPSHRLDAHSRSMLKDQVFGRYLQSLHLDCEQRADQLTCELRDFVQCVRTGRRPRVSGEDGRAALALAERVLTSIREHAWEGDAQGPVGPNQVPRPSGRLFEQYDREAA